MSQRTVYRPAARKHQRRKEWVSLPDGDICVWAMTTADSVQIVERSQNSGSGGREAGYSRGQAGVLQIMFSCYDGEEDGAKRIFGDADFAPIYELSLEELGLLKTAIERVNGNDPEEQQRLRDFTKASEALPTSP